MAETESSEVLVMPDTWIAIHSSDPIWDDVFAKVGLPGVQKFRPRGWAETKWGSNTTTFRNHPPDEYLTIDEFRQVHLNPRAAPACTGKPAEFREKVVDVLASRIQSTFKDEKLEGKTLLVTPKAVIVDGFEFHLVLQHAIV